MVLQKTSVSLMALLCLFSFASVTPIFAQDKNSKSSPSSTERSSTTESLKDIKKEKKSRYSGSVNWSLSKNNDYYSDYFTDINPNLSYEVSERLSLSISSSYSQPVSQYDDKVKRHQLGDTSISMSGPIEFKDYTSVKVSASLGLGIPTSKASNFASKRFDLSTGLSLETSISNFDVSTSHELSYSNFKYETSDATGSTYNAPFGLSNSLSISKKIGAFGISQSLALYHTKNFANSTININIFNTSVSYTVSEKISASLSFNRKDRILTNNSYFDDDNTTISMALNIKI
ncbi:MAG: hypothetical protein HOO06_04800 [Bdellovibrionaceae bacterium]|nr:hypothetical protein [Pseudobdellovibrionaceae bacterium]